MPKVTQEVWRKSSYSGDSGTDNCVEVAFVVDAVGVRDSKNTGGPALAFSLSAWRRFVSPPRHL
jgi:hypothetical protein